MGSDLRPEPPWLAGERAARALRFELGLGHGPIDIYDVIEQRGVAIAFRDLGGDDGRYIFHNGKGLILVSSTCEEASRQRFTAAHELGHHELHRFDANGEVETILIDKTVIGTGGDAREQAANSFAARLLLPTEALQARFSERAEVTAEQVVELMDRFGLSYTATVFRLHNAGRITNARRDALRREGEGQVHRLSGRPEEPRGAEPPHELQRQLAKLYRAGLVPVERLAELTGMSVEQVADTFGPPEEPGADIGDLLREIEGEEA
ncbi:MAG TPA: ImmA/IrrE family metallo-endopeptidase [Miltoncostaeaceae bacterium]|nr:ImmA/IrrE family metallo-endopeptidase [Miltoncostaeaceae bacterium]